MEMRETAGRAGRRALDMLLPPRCLACGIIVDAAGRLCAPCWSDTAFVSRPWCDCCGLPFGFDVGPETLCGRCLEDRPVWDRARAVLGYEGRGRDLVLAFKHGDRTDSAPAFGAWLARAGADLVADADLVTPVPLHRGRLFSRRYNQSALLAAALAREAGLVFVPDLLLRRRRTPSQGRLSREARLRNVRGAFAPHPRRGGQARGRRVLLVDDVLTSGATANACARALLVAGATAVDVLVLARVGGPVDP